MNSFLHVFHALEDREPRNLRTYPSVPQADESPSSSGDWQHGRKSAVCGAQELPEEVSPCVGARTANTDVLLSQYRQEVYGYERLIEQLYDLARENRYDELHDLVRARYLSIHGSAR